VFGASNFPLAFSVAGGDTASALAAGCPVVVKAHPAHPATSEIAGRAIVDAARAAAMPAGVFSMLQSTRNDIARALVQHPQIQSGWLHWKSAGRPRAVRCGGGASGTDSRVCGDGQRQPGVRPARRPRRARHGPSPKG
jgi:hypothetical protein